jgi:Reverse transcriptase (RNA-dependent DNA polymerase)
MIEIFQLRLITIVCYSSQPFQTPVGSTASYRPISNVSFLSKVVEKIVDARLSEHVCRHRLLPAVQSAYCPYHSTETAVVRVLNDMIGVLDQGHVGVLVLLYLSAAFDTDDHTILLHVERRRFRIFDKLLHWLCSFLSERKQIVRFNSMDSDDISLLCGVPQGSVLGPKRFTEYAEDVSTCFEQHRLRFHLYADDTQGLQHGIPAQAHAIVSSVESCVDDVRNWCASKRLQLNASKTEVLWFGTAAQLRKVPKCDSTIRVGGSAVEPVSVIRDLGVYIDAELTMLEHVCRTARACFFTSVDYEQSAGSSVVR